MQVTRAGGPGHGKFARIEHSIEFAGERAENSMPRPETSDQTAVGTGAAHPVCFHLREPVLA